MYIDSKTIWSIVNDNIDDVKEIIETEMKISPFGVPGRRTYFAKYLDKSNVENILEINQEIYDKTYKKLNEN